MSAELDKNFFTHEQVTAMIKEPMFPNGGSNNMFNKYLDARFESIDQRFSRVENDIGELKSDVKALDKRITSENQKTRTVTITTGIGILLGFAAIIYSVVTLQTMWLHKFLDIVAKIPK